MRFPNPRCSRLFLKNVSQHVFDIACCARTLRSTKNMPMVFRTMPADKEELIGHRSGKFGTTPFTRNERWDEKSVLTFEEMQYRRVLAGGPEVKHVKPSDVMFMHEKTLLYNPQLQQHGRVVKVLASAPLVRTTCRHAHPTTF